MSEPETKRSNPEDIVTALLRGSQADFWRLLRTDSSHPYQRGSANWVNDDILFFSLGVAPWNKPLQRFVCRHKDWNAICETCETFVEERAYALEVYFCKAGHESTAIVPCWSKNKTKIVVVCQERHCAEPTHFEKAYRCDRWGNVLE